MQDGGARDLGEPLILDVLQCSVGPELSQRAVDALGHGLKDELAEIRSLLIELVREVKAQRAKVSELTKRRRA